MYQIRTDLALETQEKMQEDHVDLKGVRFLEEKIDKNITISTVVIETENGAKTMGKPKGTYITIEAGNMDEEDEDYHREISVQLAQIIRKLIRERKEEMSVLVVGLGNREVTPDALGPCGGQPVYHKTHYKRVWKICIRGKKCKPDQQHRTGSYGTDGDGKP